MPALANSWEIAISWEIATGTSAWDECKAMAKFNRAAKVYVQFTTGTLLVSAKQEIVNKLFLLTGTCCLGSVQLVHEKRLKAVDIPYYYG